ncbi:MAG: DnaB helicase C-terminal domain-containing protein [Treponemataceae bacterium]|nr:DnaB helicase C-terminal domain-containing protein [Treponemataceae bacterium]
MNETENTLTMSKQPYFLFDDTEAFTAAIDIIGVDNGEMLVSEDAILQKYLEMKSNALSDEYIRPAILAFENKKNAFILIKTLKEHEIPAYFIDFKGVYESIAERFTKDEDAIKEELTAAADNPAQAQANQHSARAYLSAFKKHIQDAKNNPPTKTGFTHLDELFDGGLYAGLYCIGAISSLGKTSLVLQIADQIAQQGTPVLYFSLEMSRDELIARSISRETAIISRKRNGGNRTAKTARGILSGQKYELYSTEEIAVINGAIDNYKQYAGRIFYFEGVGNIGVKKIKSTVENFIKQTGTKPVVIIDYLQIIAPYDVKMTDKQNTDKNIVELKRLSRDNEIAIIGISSFNRDNYKAPVNMAAFKESGAIEYSADVLIGLQYTGFDESAEDKKPSDRDSRIERIIAGNATKAKAGDAIRIDLKVLKNRNGSKGKQVFEYAPMFNVWREENCQTPHFDEIGEQLTIIGEYEEDSEELPF